MGRAQPCRLFVPGKGLLKSGAFKLIAQRAGLVKAAPSTHIYWDLLKGMSAPESSSTGQARAQEVLNGLGSWWDVLEVAPFGKAAMRHFAAAYPGAEVTVRDLPLRSEELRQRLSRLSPQGASASLATAPSKTILTRTTTQAHAAKALPGDAAHLFAFRCALPSGPVSLLLAARRGR